LDIVQKDVLTKKPLFLGNENLDVPKKLRDIAINELQPQISSGGCKLATFPA
jgi:hypothetical protein